MFGTNAARSTISDLTFTVRACEICAHLQGERELNTAISVRAEGKFKNQWKDSEKDARTDDARPV
jgi:hypothetical protein